MWGFVNKRPDLALDLGTRNFLFSDRRSVVHQDQSFAARLRSASNADRSSFVTGRVAAEIFEKDPGHFELLKPLARGVVSDAPNCARLLSTVMKKWSPRLRGLNLLVTTPLDITSVEKAAFQRVCLDAGAAKVESLPEPTAACLGILPSFMNEKGVFFVDVGAGITEAVLYSLGGVVANASARLGGDDFENEIIQFIRNQYHFAIGRKTAQGLLDILAHGRNEMFLSPIRVRGVHLRNSLPGEIFVEGLALDSSLDRLFGEVVRVILDVLRRSPAELNADILEHGVHLSGGASQFPRLHELIIEASGLDLHPDAQPLLGVARGEIQLLQNPELMEYLARAG